MSVKLKICGEKKKREGYASTKIYYTNCFYIFFRHHSFIANLFLCLYMMASIQLIHHEFAAD